MESLDKLRNKRLCMIVFAQYPLGETRVQREAEALVQNGYDVDVICLRLPGELPVDEYKSVKIFRLKYSLPIVISKNGGLSEKFFKYLRFFLSALVKVTQLDIKRKYKSIQIHNMPDFLVFCAVVPKLLRVPIILDIHDLMPEFYSERFFRDNSLTARLIYIQEYLACRFADHVITVSELWRQVLIKRGVPENKCSVVMNVADESIFHPTEQIKYQPPNGDSFKLIYHGTFVERNGLALAIKAVDLVRHDIPHIHLSLIGIGDFLPQMKHMIKDLELDQQVSIEDLHLAEELPRIILSCHLGVVPLYNNLFTGTALSTKLMEYAALGLPAVASGTLANLTYFSDTNTEFFEPGNAEDLARCILMLYNNPDRMAVLALGSRNFNQRYNWINIGAEYVALVDRLGSKQ